MHFEFSRKCRHLFALLMRMEPYRSPILNGELLCTWGHCSPQQEWILQCVSPNSEPHRSVKAGKLFHGSSMLPEGWPYPLGAERGLSCFWSDVSFNPSHSDADGLIESVCPGQPHKSAASSAKVNGSSDF